MENEESLTIIKLLNVNAGSLNGASKTDAFVAILTKYKPDVVIVTETWLLPTKLTSDIVPDDLDYDDFRSDRGSRGGGVLIFLKRSICIVEKRSTRLIVKFVGQD